MDNLYEILRREYPTPKVSNRFHRVLYPRGAYCVGGALRLFSGEDGGHFSFPSYSKLALTLRRNNPNLSESLADQFAHAIIDSNDDGNFERAWWQLREALKFPGYQKWYRNTRYRISQLSNLCVEDKSEPLPEETEKELVSV